MLLCCKKRRRSPVRPQSQAGDFGEAASVQVETVELGQSFKNLVW
uniref:Uncharacterized protein n=1 Tax=Anguilla anguilla TaxID=7936 RepID=A0A0E9RMU4_ANGAN